MAQGARSMHWESSAARIGVSWSPDKVGEGASAFTIRRAHAGDVDAMFAVRGATRQSPFSVARLATRGITPALLAEAMATDTFGSWVCEVEHTVVGFCNADAGTGEVLVLAVRDGFEGRGIGKALLSQAVAFLRSAGCLRLWLMAGISPELRAHGFYRTNGWVPTGRTDEHNDEELTLTLLEQ